MKQEDGKEEFGRILPAVIIIFAQQSLKSFL